MLYRTTPTTSTARNNEMFACCIAALRRLSLDSWLVNVTHNQLVLQTEPHNLSFCMSPAVVSDCTIVFRISIISAMGSCKQVYLVISCATNQTCARVFCQFFQLRTYKTNTWPLVKTRMWRQKLQLCQSQRRQDQIKVSRTHQSRRRGSFGEPTGISTPKIQLVRVDCGDN